MIKNDQGSSKHGQGPTIYFWKVKPNFGEENMVGKATSVRESHMQRRKACKARK
jgi:hypothetical protein